MTFGVVFGVVDRGVLLGGVISLTGFSGVVDTGGVDTGGVVFLGGVVDTGGVSAGSSGV